MRYTNIVAGIGVAIVLLLVLAWLFMPRIQVIQNLGGKRQTVMQFP